MNSDRTKRRSAETANNAKSPPAVSSGQATRETFESIVIAVILAFLFRGFVAEAFVIPTGSMAPTLQGRHVDVECPECGYDYRTGASEENEPDQGVVVQTFCPMCQFPLPLVPPETLARVQQGEIRPSEYEVHLMREPNQRSFNGDRILVSKFAYELANPERWDVIVFKYPGNAKQNYIKRLIGMPGELIRIHHGDIYTGRHVFDASPSVLPASEAVPSPAAADGISNALRTAFAEHKVPLSDSATLTLVPYEERPETNDNQFADAIWELSDPASGARYVLRNIEFENRVEVFTYPEITRKPVGKQLALMQRVDDTEYRSKTLTRLGWPDRWQQRDTETPAWQRSDDGQFTIDGANDELAWLRYRHSYPTTDEWHFIQQNDKLPDDLLLEDGQLITDYYTYNDRLVYGVRHHHRMLGYHWVGDLAIETEVEVGGESGQIALDLVEGGVHFRCTIDVATGKATLSRSDNQPFGESAEDQVDSPSAETELQGSGTYELRFSNVDSELRLWVNDTLITFDGPTTYLRTGEVQPQWSEEDPGDLAPAGVGAQGVEVAVHQLALLRDVYYVATTPSLGGEATDYRTGFSNFEDELARVVYDGRAWQSTDLFRSRRTVDFVLGPDQFFPLGDNSPQSMDGRKWDEGPYFERDLLLGKAIFIYWPHAWRRPIPYINLRRMRFIH